MGPPRIFDHPSPNFDARPPATPIDTLILHYTGMPRAGAALSRLTDRAAKVSAHYVIDEDGSLYRLVDEDRRAWHAGKSSWRGESDINGRSIGIELVNPGHEFGYRPFPEPQMGCLMELCRDLVRRHPIEPARVLGHSDVAPQRKSDPGELFDWRRLARAGVGLWPPEQAHATSRDNAVPAPAELQEKLRRFGYGLSVTGEMDAATSAVLIALQRHFRPRRIDGVPDAETAAILDWLCAQVAAGPSA
jgi:N-acetylmuramoyl-L-alanine amidase